MKSLMKNGLFAGMLLLLIGCAGTAKVVKPDNFVSVSAMNGTMFFGTYLIDTSQYIYFNFNGDEPGMLLNPNELNLFRPGELAYTLLPVKVRDHSVKSVYFNAGQFGEDTYPVQNGMSGNGGGGGDYYPSPIFPYALEMKTAAGKINYFGRIVLTNGKFSVTDHFEEDKAMLLSRFESDKEAHDKLSVYGFNNLLAK